MTTTSTGSGAGGGDELTTRMQTSTVLAREPCAGCGAPLGADQRYCLSCGIPRAGTRLPFLDVLHAEAASAGIVEQSSRPAELLRIPALTTSAAGRGAWSGPPGGQPTLMDRVRANGPLFGLLSVLLLALLIGLLIGHWAGGGTSAVSSVPSKQIVEVKGLTLPAATAAPAAGATAAGTTTSAATEASAKSTTSATKAPTTPAPASHASNPTVSKLASSTGKEHTQAVEKALHNGGTLTTGGAPPPKEKPKPGASSAPIGGGSEVTSIE